MGAMGLTEALEEAVMESSPLEAARPNWASIDRPDGRAR